MPPAYDLSFVMGNDIQQFCGEDWDSPLDTERHPGDLESVMAGLSGVYDLRYSIPNQDDGRSTVLVYDFVSGQASITPSWNPDSQQVVDSVRQAEDPPRHGQRTESFSTDRSARNSNVDDAGHEDDRYHAVLQHPISPYEDPEVLVTDLDLLQTLPKGHQSSSYNSVLPMDYFYQGSTPINGSTLGTGADMDAPGLHVFSSMYSELSGGMTHNGEDFRAWPGVTDSSNPGQYGLGPSITLNPGQLTMTPHSGIALPYHDLNARAKYSKSTGLPKSRYNPVELPDNTAVPTLSVSDSGHPDRSSSVGLLAGAAVESQQYINHKEVILASPGHSDSTPASFSTLCSESECCDGHSDPDDGIEHTPDTTSLDDARIFREKFVPLGDRGEGPLFQCTEGSCTTVIRGTRSCPRHWRSRHSTYKPFKCKQCRRAFKRQDHAKRHLSSCHKRMPAGCRTLSIRT